jgi:mannose-6-phosphate isomerase-like protein (cupin superfamily)
MKVRRVVTGHSADGQAIFASDDEVDAITLELLPGYEFHRMWGADEAPTFPGDGRQPSGDAYFPPLGGFRFGLFTVAPESTVLADDVDVMAALTEMEQALPGMAAHMEPDEPGMHTTDTVDYAFVVSGEVSLELDNGAEVHLRPGDTIVQNGTRHRWHNRGSEPCRLVVVLVGAHRA